MTKRYEAYCLVDRHFYDSPTGRSARRPEFGTASRPLPDGWVRRPQDDWLVFQRPGEELPWQGWKVHVSGCLENAEHILDVVWDHCLSRGLSFKFLSGPGELHLRNAKYADRGGSGKLVTIYPPDEARLRQTLVELGTSLLGQQGPYILSDLRWGPGPLYVRYGGFGLRYCVTERGDLVPAIEDDTGRLVPDLRGPSFTVPDWVRLPDFLVPHLVARNSVAFHEQRYQIERVLHFSNAGGLYLATATGSDRQVVLKEARPHAGLDADGVDAVTRLGREHLTLHQLGGLEVVPRVLDYVTAGEHHFLVQEFVEGQTLNDVLSERYPLGDGPAPSDLELADYTAWALETQSRIEAAVAQVHQRGVVYGDLHPRNIILGPDGRVTLLDFEVAGPVGTEHRPGLANPDFMAPTGLRGLKVDQYALACLRFWLFMPLTTLFQLDADKAAHLAELIPELFPTVDSFLATAARTIRDSASSGSWPSAYRALPELATDAPSWRRIRSSLGRSITTSASPARADRLFPGDIEQFAPGGGLNLAFGAAGVLYALSATGIGRYPEYEKWLLERALQPAAESRVGFYDGLHGVAYTLHHLGHQESALEVLDLCLRERWELLGSDLAGGLAGIGLNLAHLGRATGESLLTAQAGRAAELVADRLGPEEEVAELSGGEHPSAGLVYGSSGPALLFVRMYELTGDSGYLDLAARALRQDLKRCVTGADGTLHVNEGRRVLPYLARGSVGIGMVLDEYLAHRYDEQLDQASQAIRSAARSVFYVQPGLFSGRAGMLLYLSHGLAPGAAAHCPYVGEHVRRLGWHAMPFQGSLAFPGDQLLRLSMDLATGTAGVLLALGAALHDQPVGLPFLTGPVRSADPQTGERRSTPVPSQERDTASTR